MGLVTGWENRKMIRRLFQRYFNSPKPINCTCGGRAKIKRWRGTYYVQCQTCTRKGSSLDVDGNNLSKQEAITDWNEWMEWREEMKKKHLIEAAKPLVSTDMVTHLQDRPDDTTVHITVPGHCGFLKQITLGEYRNFVAAFAKDIQTS